METRSRSRSRHVEVAPAFVSTDHDVPFHRDATNHNLAYGPDDAETPQQLPRRVPDIGRPTTSTPNAETTFTQESVAALISAMQRTQAEALRDIVDAMQRSPSKESQTLARCRATFSGSPAESVIAFIDAVDSYVECCGVSDDNIIKGLSMLAAYQTII
jgi:hypothetical protein